MARSRLPILLTMTCAVAGAAFPQSGQAGSEATTVAPLVVTPGVDVLGPIPLLTPEVLIERAEEAHAGAVGAVYNTCVQEASETNGLSRDALSNTEFQAQAQLQQAAQAAARAAQAALDARAGGNGDLIAQTETARLAAMRAYMSAQIIAEEARQRLADYQDPERMRQLAVMRKTPLDSNWLKTTLDENTRQRTQVDGVRGVYVPEEYRDLRLSRIVARQLTVGGRPVMRVTGVIHNPRAAAIPVPPIWVTAMDAGDNPVMSEQATSLTRGRIPAHGIFPFTYDLTPAPTGAQKTVVTFAPSLRAARPRRIPFIASGCNGRVCCTPVSIKLRQIREGGTPAPDAPWINGEVQEKARAWVLTMPVQSNPYAGR
jgi:hypothetical protein